MSAMPPTTFFMNSDSEVSPAMRRVLGVFLVPIKEELHPSTEPEEIARDQRREVRRAWKAGYQDPKMISELACLPLWTVERRLGELGYGPVVTWKKAVPRNRRTPTQTAFPRR